MELPVRILRHASDEPLISVDGAWGAAGLNLSHWPGQRTPSELRHDLSTGCALAFARLAPARRAELARGCTAIANNHYDTDGVCALFAVRHPERALELERELLDAARAGDMFQLPSERAFQIDRVIARYAELDASPIAAQLRGLDDYARYERATHVLFEELPAMLRGELDGCRALWHEDFERLRADLAALAHAQRDDVVHLDWSVWTARPGDFASQHGSGGPGRHALFGTSSVDRALFVDPRADGTRYRFVINTLSWFELVTRETLPRPNLARLAASLNELEGTHDAELHAWRAQETSTPSPELWFGAREHELFAEHCAAMRPSRLAPATVRRCIAEALRDALVGALPE